MSEVLCTGKTHGKPRKHFPIDFSLSLRAKGYSYEFIAWKLQQMGYDVSKWTVMRRLRIYEKDGDL